MKLLLLFLSFINAENYTHFGKDDRGSNRAQLPHVDGIDGFKCDQADWVEGSILYPVMETKNGKIQGSHRCKENCLISTQCFIRSYLRSTKYTDFQSLCCAVALDLYF
jgi:hypothetical protein